MQRYAYSGGLNSFGNVLSTRSNWLNVPEERFNQRISFMKTKVLLICILLLFIKCFAAFNDAENKQLLEINSKSERLKEDAISLLTQAQQNQANDNPEKKH